MPSLCARNYVRDVKIMNIIIRGLVDLFRYIVGISECDLAYITRIGAPTEKIINLKTLPSIHISL